MHISTLCTHLYIVICEVATDYKFTADGCATDSCAKVQQIMHMQCRGCAFVWCPVIADVLVQCVRVVR